MSLWPLLGLVLVLLNGCSSSSSIANTDAAVIAGWKAALTAVDAAARMANWRDPSIAATHTGAQLQTVRDNLRAEAENHEVARGQDNVLSVRVVKLNGESASVDACVNGGEILVDAETGNPVPGIAGEVGLEAFTARLLKTTSGWKVSQEKTTEGKCVGS